MFIGAGLAEFEVTLTVVEAETGAEAATRAGVALDSRSSVAAANVLVAISKAQTIASFTQALPGASPTQNGAAALIPIYVENSCLDFRG
jgi:hypothetical protein